MPTVLEWLGLPVPMQCDGRSLLPLVRGDATAPWRDAAFWEWEFRDPIGGWAEKFLGITMDQCAISVLRDEHGKYVHFTGLAPLFYDLDADPARARRTAPTIRRTRRRCSATRSACCRAAWSTWTRPSPASW